MRKRRRQRPATLALQLGIVEFFVQASELTGGTVGIFGIERPSFFGISLKSSTAYYELIATAAIAAYLLAQQIVRSRFGRALTAIREDETAATALGINPSRYKVAAFTLSAMFAGLAGTLYAYQILYINPGSFNIDWSITALSMVVIGGVGSNLGAVLGAVAVTLIRQFLFSFGDLEFLVYGIWIMAVILFFPGGLVGIAAECWRSGMRVRRRP
jgi:branched-chain amino acid transport system permease protein